MGKGRGKINPRRALQFTVGREHWSWGHPFVTGGDLMWRSGGRLQLWVKNSGQRGSPDSMFLTERQARALYRELGKALKHRTRHGLKPVARRRAARRR